MAEEKKPRLTKADLDARFTAQQEKNRERRDKKVTGEDIERRLNERKAQRAQKSAGAVPGQRARVMSLGLGIVLLACSGVLAVSTSAGTDTFNTTTAANAQQIASLQGTLQSIPAANDKSAAEHTTELEKQITQATAKGEKVASLQQDFATILFKGNTESSGNGAPSASFHDSVEHRKTLAPYFVARAFPVSDVEAYAPGSVLPFDAGTIDPRFPWYIGYGKDGKVLDPAASSWRLVSVVATDVPGVLDVTWLDQSPTTGDLFAWASASYYASSNAFGNLTVGHTTLGTPGPSSINKVGA